MNQFNRFFVLVGALTLILSACAPQTTSTPTLQIVQDTPTTIVPIETTTPEPPPIDGGTIGEAVPAALLDQVAGLNIPFNLDVSDLADTNGIRFQWIYALVAPFPTVKDGVTSDELRSLWIEGGILLVMEESTLRAFTVIWGEPGTGSVRSVVADQLLDVAWKESAWAIVPFEYLDPKWKVLTIDGQSPIRKKFDVSLYPLVVTFTLDASALIDTSSLSLSNYDPSKLTTIIMTGITALVRATAYTMEMKGVLYPGEKIRDMMREADIAHVANHVPFYTGCRFPRPDQVALVFCSDPKYIDLFTDIGVDLVELTGHHFEDYGPAATLETLEIYKSHNIVYFGGGANKEDAIKPALFENHGNKIAFIGCNRLDTGGPATATDNRPGAAPCDFEYLKYEITQLRSEGYVVIATNHWNQTYDYLPNPQQIIDFRLMVDWGASLVLGSQAHYAQTMEFYKDTFIHYGQGNLFFDQMGEQDWMPKGIRREFLDRYVVYDGKLISIELITAMLEDYSRPRIMNEEERAGFLQEYFYYSGWIGLIPSPTPTITPTLTPMSIP